ncbi:peptidoglycan-binding protein [Candidatus Liberibacter solanacearum]|uniref:Peptidoglycan-binding protein n=1 Tax=Candidatus Liberibacter solanacearum TaxID=556287 RepID=A0A424FLV9_9HYPH|nr:peptidoglycan-binding domain-containing protein [Candidatus Liberibacter solanacearum]RPD37150.1 peptidoglycan-binding protein [Candidatus Liberibacter solanacearum]
MFAKKYEISFLSLCSKIIWILGKIISRYPTFVLMMIGYIVIFLWILFNALWNQKGKHPSPIFTTRHSQSNRIILGSNHNSKDFFQEKSMTFKVKRMGDRYDTILLHDSSSVEKNKKLLKKIQKKLQQYGFYYGLCDGVLNTQTIEAIYFFQRIRNIPVDGIPNDSLLNTLQSMDQDEFPKKSSPHSSSNDFIASLIKNSRL